MSVMYWRIVLPIGAQGTMVLRYRSTHWTVAEAIRDMQSQYGGEPRYDGMDFA